MNLRILIPIGAILVLALSTLTLTHCRKNKIVLDQDAQLELSQDTLLFDTLFTTIGSTTQFFTIRNTHNQAINVANIQLLQGTNSMFRINVNGDAGVNFENIEIPANDSLYVFVEVTIDPNNGTNPLVVEDKIVFLTNGNQQQVVLNAWGQDAYFHVNEIITVTTTWPNDKPHVIYNYCAVDSARTLTIPAGTKVHGHSGALLYIYKGALQVQGSLGNEVEFSQDRTEDYLLYSSDSVAGQWRGINFFAPMNSTIEYARIKNATIGIQVDTATGNDSVTLKNVSVNNSVYAGIVTQGANVHANSCLFGNAGQFSAFASIGGKLFFDHCTFANHWQGQRSTGLFVVKNYYEDVNGNIQFRPFTQATFSNNIIYGTNDNEFVMDTLSRSSTGLVPNLNFIHCQIKTEDAITNPTFFQSCWKNQDPNFVDPGSWDFHASGAGIDNRGTVTDPINDLDGNPRASNGNDLGAYNNP